MNRKAKITAVVILVTIGLHASAGRIYAQAPNVVIQWNRLAQAQYGPEATNEVSETHDVNQTPDKGGTL